MFKKNLKTDPNFDSEPPLLRSSRRAEWNLVGIFSLLFITCFLISKVHVYRARNTLAAYHKHPERFPSQLVSVTIQGAVERPGEYRVKRGDCLSKALRKSRPKACANLRGIDPNKQLVAPMSLNIEELSELIVFVRIGEGEPQAFSLPLRSRICDLKSRIPLAQSEFFRSRRLLKDGETITVPTN